MRQLKTCSFFKDVLTNKVNKQSNVKNGVEQSEQRCGTLHVTRTTFFTHVPYTSKILRNCEKITEIICCRSEAVAIKLDAAVLQSLLFMFGDWT